MCEVSVVLRLCPCLRQCLRLCLCLCLMSVSVSVSVSVCLSINVCPYMSVCLTMLCLSVRLSVMSFCFAPWPSLAIFGLRSAQTEAVWPAWTSQGMFAQPRVHVPLLCVCARVTSPKTKMCDAHLWERPSVCQHLAHGAPVCACMCRPRRSHLSSRCVSIVSPSVALA